MSDSAAVRLGQTIYTCSVRLSENVLSTLSGTVPAQALSGFAVSQADGCHETHV